MEIRPTMTDSVARLAGSYSIILFIMRLHRVALYSRTFVERGSHLCSCVLYSGHVRNVKKVSQRMLGICRFYHARLMYREHLHANTRKKWNETHNARDSRTSQNDAIWLLNWLLQWRVHFGKVAKICATLRRLTNKPADPYHMMLVLLNVWTIRLRSLRNQSSTEVSTAHMLRAVRPSNIQ